MLLPAAASAAAAAAAAVGVVVVGGGVAVAVGVCMYQHVFPGLGDGKFLPSGLHLEPSRRPLLCFEGLFECLAQPCRPRCWR